MLGWLAKAYAKHFRAPGGLQERSKHISYLFSCISMCCGRPQEKDNLIGCNGLLH